MVNKIDSLLSCLMILISIVYLYCAAYRCINIDFYYVETFNI